MEKEKLQLQHRDVIASDTGTCMMWHDAWSVVPYRNCNLGTRYLQPQHREVTASDTDTCMM